MIKVLFRMRMLCYHGEENEEKQNEKLHSHSASHSVLYSERDLNPHAHTGTGF